MSRWLALVVASLAVAGSLYGGLLVHRAFGVNRLWELPRHFDLCEIRYDRVTGFPDVPTARTLHLAPTIFRLPLPLPDVRPDAAGGTNGGCPSLVVLDLPDGGIEYAHVQGGP